MASPRVIAVLIGAVLGGCLDATAERTGRDLHEIGRADLGHVQATIDQGVALAVDGSRPFVRFRANAPDVTLTFTSTAAEERTVAVELVNAFAASEVSVPFVVQGPNTLAFSVAVPAAATSTVSVRPVGTQVAAPFRFAWVGDVQGGNDGFARLRDLINADPTLELTLFAGDITRRGSRQEIDDFVAVASGLARPWYSLLGNHESLSGQPLAFQHTVGRINVRFDHRGARFLLLDSSSATLDPWVYGFIARSLVPEAPATRIVAMHLPPLDPEGLRDGGFSDRAEAARLLALLASGGTDLLLAGHIHTLRLTWQAGIETWISGNGGYGSGAAFDGTGPHFLAVTVDPARGVVAVDPVLP